MNQYKIEQKILTLVYLLFLEQKEKPATFEFDGIEFSHCDFSHQNGWQKDEWVATEIIEAQTWLSAFAKFRKKLFSIIPKISFISQAYIEFRAQPFLVHKKESQIAVINYAVENKPVGLMFGKNEKTALTELVKNTEITKEFFLYWNDAVNTAGYSAKLLLMFSAIEALTKKPNGEPNYKFRKELLGDDLKKEIFGEKGYSGDALRNRLVHGEYFNENDIKNYVEEIHKRIIHYFNKRYLSKPLIIEDVKNPQRHFFGNIKSSSNYIERMDKGNSFELEDILENFEKNNKYLLAPDVVDY